MSEQITSGTNKFTFHYVPSPYHSRHPGDKKESCPVEVKRENGRVSVIITEPDSHAINQEIEEDFSGIARQLYNEHLEGTPLPKVTWYKHDVRDNDGFETLCLAKFQDGAFGRPKFTLEQHIANYTLCGLDFTDDELVIRVGYHMNPKQVRLPLSRFPSLAQASQEERRQMFTIHKHHTVVYWFGLKEKLVARDVTLFDGSTEKKPDHVVDRDFIYETPSPFFG